MNPETKLTTEELELICSRQNITYESHSRIKSGFSHEVHRLNDDLVIKLFNSDNARSFKKEAAILASISEFPKPRLIASSSSNEEINRSYIIMSYVPGFSLGSRWHLANDQQRESLIREVCEALRAINKIDPATLNLHLDYSWQESVVKRCEQIIPKLIDKKVFDEKMASKVMKTLNECGAALKNSKLFATYWDIHFDNFIVNDDLKLQSIIDLENIDLTPLDYPIFVVKKQSEEPEKYLSEGDEKFADKNDYKHLMEWYKEYYPEMFAFDDLDKRIKVYQLLDTLHLLVDWSHVKSLHARLKELTA